MNAASVWEPKVCLTVSPSASGFGGAKEPNIPLPLLILRGADLRTGATFEPELKPETLAVSIVSELWADANGFRPETRAAVVIGLRLPALPLPHVGIFGSSVVLGLVAATGARSEESFASPTITPSLLGNDVLEVPSVRDGSICNLTSLARMLSWKAVSGVVWGAFDS